MHSLRPLLSVSFVLVALIASFAGSSRAEGDLVARGSLPEIPDVETGAQDLAVLRLAQLAGKAFTPAPAGPGATAEEDRNLPPTTPGPASEPEPEEARILERFAAKAPGVDTAGGDDLLVFSSPSIRGYEMEITEDGDIYLAIAHVPEGSPVRIDVFLSENGGNDWVVWGSRASANYHYDWPSLHVAEGPNARLFLAYVYYDADDPDVQDHAVIVGSSPLDTELWNLSLAMWVVGSDMRSPMITSDHLSWNNYRVYLTARESDITNSSDIWFGVSNDLGVSFDSYEIGTLDSYGIHYWSPSIAVGWGGYVHVAWYLYNNAGANLSHAIRYRRATNRAFGGAGSWDPTLAITSTTDPAHHQYVSVATQTTDQSAVLNYRRSGPGGFENVIRTSMNSGGTWDPANEWTPDGHRLSEVGADAGRFFYTGRRYQSIGYGFTTATAAEPGLPVETEILADEYYASIINTAGSKAHPDPSRGNRFALVWKDETASPSDDTHLYFDAEWRGDAGYPNHHDAFPVPLAVKPATPPAIVNLKGFGNGKHIIFADEAGDVHVIDGSGAELPGFPASTGQTIADESLAVGDLDGDGKKEIVVGATNGRVFAFKYDGSTVPGWPVSLGTRAPAYVSIGTVSRLAKRDVVITSGNEIHLLRPDGSAHDYANFPIVNPEVMHAAAAIGDLEADGRMEIVVAGGQSVRAYHYQAGMSIKMTVPGADLRNTPSLGDLDFDGTLEIVVPTDLGQVWIFEHDSSTYPGWPYEIGEVDVIQEVALADFGVSLELVLDLAFAQRGSRVHARAADDYGLPGWPTDTSPGWYLLGGPIVASLNGSTSAQVTIGDRGNDVHGWLGWLFGMPGWPKDVGAKINLSPGAGDIDGDGLNEVVYLTETEVVVLDVNGEPVTEAKRSWPMYGHDPQRTSCADCPVDLVTAADPARSSVLAFAPPSPNPSSGRTMFSYRLPGRAVVQLEVFDLRGRRVRSLMKEEQGAGDYQISWDGRDGNARQVGNGQYYGRLSVVGGGISESLTRKITLVR